MGYGTGFETTLKRLQLPMFTVMYSDRDGHIMHLFNGQVPIRGEGDFEFWSGYIPGDTSATLWTKLHPYEDLPRVLDPSSGWLQNANDPPWTTTFPGAITPDDYPSYMAPRQPMAFRAQRSARMLAEDEQISFEEMVEYKHSTHMELAERLLDELTFAARQQGRELARRAADVLDAWDRNADADSRGAVLFAFWTQEVDDELAQSLPSEAFTQVELNLDKPKIVWVTTIEIEISRLKGKRRLAIVMNAPTFNEATDIDYFITNVDPSIVTPGWVVQTYSQRNWVEVFYREAKGWLGLREYQVRDKRSLLRHFILVYCAYTFILWHQRTGGLRRRWANKSLDTFTDALEAFRTAVSYRFVNWLNQNRDVFTAYKASLGYIWA